MTNIWLTPTEGPTRLCYYPAHTTALAFRNMICQELGGRVKFRLLRNGREYSEQCGPIASEDEIRVLLDLTGGSEASEAKDGDGDIKMRQPPYFRQEEINRMLLSESAQQRALEDRPTNAFFSEEKTSGVKYHAPKLFIAATGWRKVLLPKIQ